MYVFCKVDPGSWREKPRPTGDTFRAPHFSPTFSPIFHRGCIEKVKNFFLLVVYIGYTFLNYKLMTQSMEAQIFQNSVKPSFFSWFFSLQAYPGLHENPGPE